MIVACWLYFAGCLITPVLGMLCFHQGRTSTISEHAMLARFERPCEAIDLMQALSDSLRGQCFLITRIATKMYRSWTLHLQQNAWAYAWTIRRLEIVRGVPLAVEMRAQYRGLGDSAQDSGVRGVSACRGSLGSGFQEISACWEMVRDAMESVNDFLD